MKNKWMTREVQRTLPENYVCLQCGISKIFCCYSSLNVDKEWRDPGIVGVTSIISHKYDFSTFIRLYELDNVC